MKLQSIFQKAKANKAVKAVRNLFKSPNYVDSYGISHVFVFGSDSTTEVLIKDGKRVGTVEHSR